MANKLIDPATSPHVKDVTKVELPATMEKAALFVVNDYNGTKYDLGLGPDNDGYHMSKLFSTFGFDCYYLRNARKAQFLQYLGHFFKNVTKHMALFYVGHGTNIKDLDGDEDDGFDEALFFVDGVVVDDVLIHHLIENKNPESVLTLITDACHSGTIWDIQSGNFKGRELPAKIMSISAAADKQTAKQTVVEKMEQGMFSYNFRKLIKGDANLKPRDLKRDIKTALQKFGQTCAIATTSAELLDIPIMQP